MDIEANWNEVCELISKTPNDPNDYDRIMELLLAGHSWLMNGGFPPKSINQPASVCKAIYASLYYTYFKTPA